MIRMTTKPGALLTAHGLIDAEHRLVPVPEQQRALRRIKKLAADGLSPYRISAALADNGVKLSHVTVRKIIAGRPGAA